MSNPLHERGLIAQAWWAWSRAALFHLLLAIVVGLLVFIAGSGPEIFPTIATVAIVVGICLFGLLMARLLVGRPNDEERRE